MQKFPLFKGMQATYSKCQSVSRTEDLLPYIDCNKDWPSCFLDSSQGSSLAEFFVYRVQKFDIRNDYFYPNKDDVIACSSDEEEGLPRFGSPKSSTESDSQEGGRCSSSSERGISATSSARSQVTPSGLLF
jgi:hypothetical protein